MSQTKKRLALAILCGIVAAVTMFIYSSGVKAEAVQSRQQALSSYGGEQVEVYVSTRNIAAGETLSASNVSLQLWLSDLLPPGALGDQSEVFGQIVSVPMLINEPVVTAKLGELKTAISVPAGLCGVSIPSQDVLAVGGEVSAGCFVTVYASDGKTVELIAEEVLVLETSNGAYQSTTGSTGSRPQLAWVTLAVEPELVQELIAASSSRKLHLVLPGDELNE